MSEEDEIEKLLRQPATKTLMLLLVLGIVLVVVVLMALSRADEPHAAHAIVLREAARGFAVAACPCNSIAAPAVSLGDTN